MTDLIDTTEMYLRTILELEEENGIPGVPSSNRERANAISIESVYHRFRRNKALTLNPNADRDP